MNLLLLRRDSFHGATIGKLYIDDVLACHVLEDQVREIVGQPVGTWKVKGATAIPIGTYAVTLEESMRFGPDTLTVCNVPGFSYIRMHAGNTAADTRSGTRPSFTPAASPQDGLRLFEHFVARARARHPQVETGRFGADMKVSLTNDGPVTFWLRVAPA